MATSWTIDGISNQTREAVLAVAKQVLMPAASSVEQALQKALGEGLDRGVPIEEIEARIRKVVASELQPVREALARREAGPGAVAPAVPLASAGAAPATVSPVTLMRERMQQRRGAVRGETGRR